MSISFMLLQKNFSEVKKLRKKKDRTVPEITVPKGYDLLDLIDTDDKGYDFGDAVMIEEVKVNFERNSNKQ